MEYPMAYNLNLENLVNQFLAKHPELNLKGNPYWEEENLKTEFSLSTPEGTLDFQFDVPKTYPLSKSRFVCPERRNTAHCLEEGTVCIVPPFCPDPARQLEEDWKCLMEWMERFVIGEEAELRYAYPTLPRLPFYLVFSEGKRNKELKPGQHGRFSYAQIQHLNLIKESLPTVLTGEIAGHKADWSSFYAPLNAHQGYWFFLGNEPRTLNGELISNHKEFETILPIGLKKIFREIQTGIEKNPSHLLKLNNGLIPGHFPVLVGYPIEDQNGSEVHWEMVLYPVITKNWMELARGLAKKLNLPSELLPESSKTPAESPPILWGSTLNANYERFFGRGRFCDTLTKAKIAVIGVGAIGGTLADMLVRGGCRNLSLYDHDMIQPGNICRSVYPFLSVNRSKTKFLRDHLIRTSPYVEVEDQQSLPFLDPKHPGFPALKETLEGYDIIFDCSANTRLAWLLDAADLSTLVLNLSVTDGAQELLMVSDPSSILDAKEDLLKGMNTKPQPSFYEGIGCWSPTFRANIADLNGLLSVALSRINRELEAGRIPDTFVL